MSRKLILVAPFLALLIGVALIFQQAASNKNGGAAFQASEQVREKTIVKIGTQTFIAEVARSDVDKAQGLSDRKSLGKDSGMLFVFESPTKPTFWMKDMLFPLDFVWINDELNVTEITRNVPAPSAGTTLDGLVLYQPKDEIVYVLEVNSGAASAITPGDKVTLGTSTTL